MKLVKLYALWMSMLIICMPIATAAAIGSISEVKVYGGTDKVDGYSRIQNDPLNIEALVRIEGDSDIQPTQLVIEDSGFTSCSVEGSSFRCKYVDEELGLNEPRAETFSLRLYDNQGAVVDSRGLTLVYDGLPPEVSKFEITQSNEKVVVNYEVKDLACQGTGCNGKCAGVKTLKFAELRDVDLSSKTGCVQTGTEEFEFSSGTHKITMEVVDKVGLSTFYSSDFFSVDKKGPQVGSTVSLSIGGASVQHIGANSISNVDVVVDIVEDKLDSVYGDLSDLYPAKAGYSDMKAKIVDLGSGRYQAKWQGVTILPKVESGVVKVRAKDAAGNEASGTATFNVKIDSVAPEAVELESIEPDGRGSCVGGVCHVQAEGNTIRLKIKEEGSGFNKVTLEEGVPQHFAVLNMGELNSQYSQKRADDCKKEADGFWYCLWKDVRVSRQHKDKVKVYVVHWSQDDVGNEMKGITGKDFLVDTVAPELIDDVKVGSGSGLDYVLQGRGLNVEFKVKEDSQVRAVGHYKNLIGDDKDFPVDCSKAEDGVYECKWNSLGTVVPGPLAGQAYTIDVSDLAGNKLELEKTADVVADESASQDYWSASVKATPSAIAKDTLSIPLKVGFLVSLDAVAPQIRVVGATMTGCSGTMMTLKAPVVIGNEDSWSLYVGGNLQSGVSSSYGVVTDTCTLSVTSIVGRTRLTEPQQINVTFSIPIVDPTMGTIGDRVADKIKKAQDRASAGLGSAFEKIEKIYDILDRLCGVYKGVTTMSNAFNIFSVKAAPSIEATKPGSAAANKAIRGGMGSLEKLSDGLGKSVSWACKLIDCDPKGFSPFYKRMAGIGKGPSGEARQPGTMGVGSLQVKKTMWPSDPKNNLILSLIAPCIPGVIYNLKKLKEIQCVYLDCLQNQVPKGTPVQFCDAQYGYQQCRFVYGQIFELIPFAHAFKQLGMFFKNLLHDPLSLVFGVGTMICGKSSSVGGVEKVTLTETSLCKFLRSAPKIAKLKESADQIKGMKKLLSDFDAEKSVCGKVDLG